MPSTIPYPHTHHTLPHHVRSYLMAVALPPLSSQFQELLLWVLLQPYQGSNPLGWCRWLTWACLLVWGGHLVLQHHQGLDYGWLWQSGMGWMDPVRRRRENYECFNWAWNYMWCTRGTSDILGKMSFWYHCKDIFSFNLIPKSSSYSSYFLRYNHLCLRPLKVVSLEVWFWVSYLYDRLQKMQFFLWGNVWKSVRNQVKVTKTY